MIFHIPGSAMPADMGTKILSGPKMEELKRKAGMKKWKTSEEKEEKGSEDGRVKTGGEEELKKVLRMIVMASTLSMAKGQGEEEETTGEEKIEESYDWQMMGMLILAIYGLVMMMRRFVEMAFQAWEVIKKKREEEAGRKKKMEPESEKEDDEKEAGPAGSSTDRPPTPEGEEDESSKGKEEGHVEERDPRPRTARERTVSRRRRVIVTPYGTKYHINSTCPTLANTRRPRDSMLCPVCTDQQHRDGETLYISGPGQDAHRDRGCRGSPRPYQQCSVCPTFYV